MNNEGENAGTRICERCGGLNGCSLVSTVQGAVHLCATCRALYLDRQLKATRDFMHHEHYPNAPGVSIVLEAVMPDGTERPFTITIPRSVRLVGGIQEMKDALRALSEAPSGEFLRDAQAINFRYEDWSVPGDPCAKGILTFELPRRDR